jgi:hypothetical protein
VVLQRQPVASLDLTDEERLKLLLQGVPRSKAMCHKDLEVMMDEGILRLFCDRLREASRGGVMGLLQDGKLICIDYGF